MNEALHSALLVLVAALITFGLRALPFLIFRGSRKMPEAVSRAVTLLPPAIMGVLVIYCLKDSIVMGIHTIPALIAAAFVVLLHLWKKNTLLSIAAGTAVYMILIRLL